MLSDDQLRGFKPAFVTPCYGAKTTVTFVNSLLQLNNALWSLGMNAVVRVSGGDSLVTKARNQAVAEFLGDPSLTHLFWIDSDIGFTPEQAFRLLRADRDVVAGAYPVKRLFWPDSLPPGLTRETFHARYQRYPVNSDAAIRIDADGFAEVAEAPTGFMVIRRRVFEIMMKEMPDLQYVPDGPPDLPFRDLYYRFFDTLADKATGRYLSEDFAFCHRWRDLGGRIFIDTTSRLSHLGEYLYEGDFAATLAIEPNHAVGGDGTVS